MRQAITISVVGNGTSPTPASTKSWLPLLHQVDPGGRAGGVSPAAAGAEPPDSGDGAGDPGDADRLAGGGGQNSCRPPRWSARTCRRWSWRRSRNSQRRHYGRRLGTCRRRSFYTRRIDTHEAFALVLGLGGVDIPELPEAFNPHPVRERDRLPRGQSWSSPGDSESVPSVAGRSASRAEAGSGRTVPSRAARTTRSGATVVQAAPRCRRSSCSGLAPADLWTPRTPGAGPPRPGYQARQRQPYAAPVL